MTNWANAEAPTESRAEWAAMVACFAMIAYQLGAKAVRDAFFLSQFEVTSLPAMVIVAALVSIAAVFAATSIITRFTPARVVPASFAVSALLHALVWLMADSSPRASAVIVYLLSVGVGSILTSGFWSMLNERFDTYRAKSLVGRVAGACTLGGIMSGIIAERVAASASLTTMLPVLAFYQLVCGVLMLWMRPAPGGKSEPPRLQPEASGLAVMRQAPYLQTLAALVILGTFSAAMIDYVFKAAALSHFGKGEQLLRFLALFYGGASVLSFVLQATVSRIALASLGTARTVATLPFAVTVGGVLALFSGGLWLTTIARGLETILRGSLFRAGYEIFYMPMPLHEKRAAKGVIDVAFDRLGDALGSGTVSLIILLNITPLAPAILAVAVLASLVGLYFASRLEGAYLDVLEQGMRDRTAEVVAAASAQETMGLTMIGGSMPFGPAIAAPVADPSTNTGTHVAAVDPVTTPNQSQDQLVKFVQALRSPDPRHAKQVLFDAVNHPELIGHVITLLKEDTLVRSVVRALSPVAENHAGQLIDALRNPATDFVIRRRIPRVLSNTPRQIVADGLLLGLNDRRFEVRYECGRVLAELAAKNRLLQFVPAVVFGYVQKEVAVSKPVWDSHRLLDGNELAESSPIFDEFLRDRTSRGLQHLFALLSLVMPAEPLRLAFHGLHVDDPHARGTALEYLSSALPKDIRDHLWPLIDKQGARPTRDPRSREEVLAELMRTDQTIYLRIEELRKKSDA